ARGSATVTAGQTHTAAWRVHGPGHHDLLVETKIDARAPQGRVVRLDWSAAGRPECAAQVGDRTNDEAGGRAAAFEHADFDARLSHGRRSGSDERRRQSNCGETNHAGPSSRQGGTYSMSIGARSMRMAALTMSNC